jgi:hypothetical protein
VNVPLLKVPYEDWHCPNCGISERTAALAPNASRFHVCPGLHMLTAPLVRSGTRAKVTAEERQDYLGREWQAHGDDGKPYMAVRATWDDGEELAVNAGCAHAELRA